jgi:hypothetical protein
MNVQKLNMNGSNELAGGIGPPVLIDYLSTDEFATIADSHIVE